MSEDAISRQPAGIAALRLAKQGEEDYRERLGHHKLYWTLDRTTDGLRAMVAEIDRIPSNVAEYARLKRGRLDWPPPRHVTGYFGSVAAAFESIGEAAHPTYRPWSDADTAKLVRAAKRGKSRVEIAAMVGRSESAVRYRLHRLGLKTATPKHGLTAKDLAVELGWPISRVLDMIADGRIPAERPPGRRGYRISREIANQVIAAKP